VVTPERKAELRLLLDSRVEKWKSDVGWWAAVAEELLDALGAREQTPTAGGAQAGRADEAADTAGASAAGEKPGALTLAYEYLRAELARLGEEYDHLDHDTRNKLESLAHDHAKAVAERDDARAEVARLQKALDHLTPARHQVGGPSDD
jgi:hypothetical protein